jgi:hypothetical protein
MTIEHAARVLMLASIALVACDDDKPPPRRAPRPKPVVAKVPASASARAVASSSAAAPKLNPPKRIGEGFGLGKVIALHEDYVYWVVRAGANCTDKPEICGAASDGSIQRAPKEGGVPKEVVGSLYTPASLAFDEKNVLWTMCGSVDYVQRCQVTTAPQKGGKRHVLYDAGPDLVENVAWAGSLAIWAEPGKSRIQGTDTKQDKPSLFAKTGDVTDVFAYGNTVYWTEGRALTPDGEVKQAPVGGAPSTLASKRRLPHLITADEKHVYWAETAETEAGQPNQVIVRLDVAGGEPKTVVRGLSYIDDIAVAGDRVVFVTADSVAWAPKSGGEPRTLAEKLKSPHGAAADDTHAYWIADDKVWRVEFPK